MTREPHIPKVAVVGTEGSGKTVLVVTLAARFCEGQSRYFLEPKNRATVRYMRSAFDTLNGTKGPPQWLPSTDPGTMCELDWDLHVDGERRFALRMVDAAGQDFRDLFGEEKAISNAGVTPLQQDLVEFVKQADILILTVDLEDFVAETDADRRDTSEWTLKFAIDQLIGHDKRKRGILVFTGKDRYQQYEQELGSWTAVAKRYLPVASRTALDHGQVSVLAVSAVNDTQLDPSGANRYVPKPGFTSAGMEELLDWIAGQGGEVRAAVQRLHDDAQKAEAEREKAVRDVENKQRWTVWWTKVLPKVFGAFVVSVIVWRQLLSFMGFGVWEKQPIREPVEVWKGIYGFRTKEIEMQIVGHRDVCTRLTGFGDVLALTLAGGVAWSTKNAITGQSSGQA
jgi:hypothetical protein